MLTSSNENYSFVYFGNNNYPDKSGYYIIAKGDSYIDKNRAFYLHPDDSDDKEITGWYRKKIDETSIKRYGPFQGATDEKMYLLGYKFWVEC